MKIITLSFDDGEIFDIRLADLLRKYNLKATFYLCSAHLGLEGDLPTGRHYKKVYTDILSQTYDGFEIGAHGANHRGFTKISEAELIDSIIADIKTFTPYTRKPIICCAYPGGATNETVIEILQRTQPVMFARTVCKDGKLFDSPTNPYLCVPSVHLFDENIDTIIDEFDGLSSQDVNILHIYGHSWEMEWERENGWDTCERIFSRLSKIHNATYMDNGDTYSYVFKKVK